MTSNIPQAVNELITEYRRFLRTSYRFLDERLRRQFEDHLDRTDVIVRGPYVTLAQEYEKARTLLELVQAGVLTPELSKAKWPFWPSSLRLRSTRPRGARGIENVQRRWGTGARISRVSFSTKSKARLVWQLGRKFLVRTPVSFRYPWKVRARGCACAGGYVRCPAHGRLRIHSRLRPPALGE